MRVALRGDDDVVEEALEASDASVVTEADADVLVVAGERPLVSIADDRPASPVLPVSANERYHTVARHRVGEAVGALCRDEYYLVEHSLLNVAVGEETVGRAALDVSLMTSDPARISEYAVHVEGGRERVEQVRADGVVVATPVGSTAYARAAGGPILGGGTGLSVVPVAPFETLSATWVLRPPLTLTVERDEGAVSLFVDDAFAREVDPADATHVTAGPGVSFVRVPGMNDHD